MPELVLNPGICPLSEALKVLEVLFIDFFFFQFESAIDSYLTISVQIKIHCVITTVLMYFHSSVLRLPQVSKNRLLERMNLLFRHHCTLKENLFNSSGNNCKYSGNNIRKNKP